MAEIEFLDVNLQRDEQHETARARERFSVPGRPLDEPDFEVLSDNPHGGKSDAEQEGAAGRRRERPTADHEGTNHEECYACPIGVAYGTARGVRPETGDRLANAIADLVEAAAAAIEMFSGEAKRTRDRLRRVDIE